MWNLLKESPASKEIYNTITNGNVHPLPYCRTRWCEQAAETWAKYCKFVEHLMTLPKSIKPKNNKSYDSLLL